MHREEYSEKAFGFPGIVAGSGLKNLQVRKNRLGPG